jgi:membrane protease subunit HflC
MCCGRRIWTSCWGREMRKWILLVAGLVVVGWLAYTIAFAVDETQYAVVTRFGEPVAWILDKPGLHVKWPWPVDSVIYFDKRLQTFEHPRADLPFKEYLTRDPKNVEVSTCTCWRIGRSQEALRKFLETVRTRERAEGALGDLIVAELGARLGQHDLAELISTDGATYALPTIVDEIGSACAARAAEAYGVAVVDFRLTRLNFPPQNRRSVFERMRAERQQIAARYRSEGEEEAMKIRAAADKEKQTILSDAYKQAEQIRGRADAQVTRIYADAYGRDPAFYEFLRTLEFY